MTSCHMPCTCHVSVPVSYLNMRSPCTAGLHLIKHAAWRTLERGGQFVLLGSAPDPKIQACTHLLLPPSY